METLKQVIMRRDGFSSEEADELIQEAKDAVMDGEDPEDVLAEMFQLEPDYVFDLVDWS